MEMSRSLLQKLLGCSMSLGLLLLLSMVVFLDAQASSTAITISPATNEALPEGFTEYDSISAEPISKIRPLKFSPPWKTSFLLKNDINVSTFKTAPSTDTLKEVENRRSFADSHSMTEHPIPVSGKSALNDISVEEPTNQSTSAVKNILVSSNTTVAMAKSTLDSISTTVAMVKSTLASSNTTTSMVRSTLAFRNTTVAVAKSTLASSNTTVAVVKSTLASSNTTVMGSSPKLHPRGKPGQSTKGKDKTTVYTPHDTKIDISGSGPGFWSTTLMTPTVGEGSDPGTRGSTPSTNRVKIIAAIVFPLLLLLILVLLFVYCRRRHRSGSTSFNAAQWAGQARVPDDSGLEKEAEQGKVILGAGEDDSKRDTLVTFVGKRQSRVPSVAMEELAKKEDGVENQKLLGGLADTGFGAEGDGELNGKLLEPFEQSSQETLPPLGPASQDS